MRWRQLIADSFAWFKDLVRQRRGMSDDELARVDDGRVFTGRQGIPLKLADAIGGEREAIEWLQAQKGVAKGLPVRDWKTEPGFLRAEAHQSGGGRGRYPRVVCGWRVYCVRRPGGATHRLTGWFLFGSFIKGIDAHNIGVERNFGLGAST